MKLSVIIPTYNAANYLQKLLQKLKEQNLKDLEIIVVDSSSPDGSLAIAEKSGVRTMSVSKEAFDHGGTRSLAGKKASGDILIYMTQDVMPVSNQTIENIVRPFLADKNIGGVYGRQVPYPEASPFSTHSRYFGYPEASSIFTLQDKDKYKIKTAFLSNAFSAYSRKAMEKIGFFKENLISTEDTYAGAKMLLAGYNIFYAADAAVYHSHNYTPFQEFKRYFDIGSFHKSEEWIIREFGKANDEGLKYVLSEFRYLIQNKKFLLLPEFVIRIMLKYIGYRLGFNFKFLPRWLILKFSMHKGWWIKNWKPQARQ